MVIVSSECGFNITHSFAPEKCLREMSFIALPTARTASASTAAIKIRRYVVLCRCELGFGAGTPILDIHLSTLVQAERWDKVTFGIQECQSDQWIPSQ